MIKEYKNYSIIINKINKNKLKKKIKKRMIMIMIMMRLKINQIKR
jgi:hypothetical protein